MAAGPPAAPAAARRGPPVGVDGHVAGPDRSSRSATTSSSVRTSARSGPGSGLRTGARAISCTDLDACTGGDGDAGRGGDPKLQDLVLSVHHAVRLTFGTADAFKIIEKTAAERTSRVGRSKSYTYLNRHRVRWFSLRSPQFLEAPFHQVVRRAGAFDAAGQEQEEEEVVPSTLQRTGDDTIVPMMRTSASHNIAESRGASMAVSVGSVVLNVSNIGRAEEFWSKALGYVPQPDDPAFLAPENGEGPRLHLDDRDRTHLDLWVNRQDSDLQTEAERLISLGAARVDWDYPPNADFVVLADTEGNLLCVVA